VRIYAVADVHANAARLERIQATIHNRQPDVLVIAGDIINYRRPEPVLERLNRMPVPVLVVRGNSDPAFLEKRFSDYPNIVSLHAQTVPVNATPFVGLSGTVPVPFRSRIGFRQRHLFDRVAPLIDGQTVLVVHPPPFGVQDRFLRRLHAGSRMVYDLMEKRKPRVLICGHIHEDAGTVCAGSTLVVNCSMARFGNGALITLQPGLAPRAEMLGADE